MDHKLKISQAIEKIVALTNEPRVDAEWYGALVKINEFLYHCVDFGLSNDFLVESLDDLFVADDELARRNAIGFFEV